MHIIGRTDAEAPVLCSPDVKSQLIGKDPDAGKDWGQEEKGTSEDKMVGWHQWLNGHEFAQTLGDSEVQGKRLRVSKTKTGSHEHLKQMEKTEDYLTLKTPISLTSQRS